MSSNPISEGIKAFNKLVLKSVETVVRPMPVVDDKPLHSKNNNNNNNSNSNNDNHKSKTPETASSRHFPTFASAHGMILGNDEDSLKSIKLPFVLYESDELARPGYDEKTNKTEFMDQPETLQIKIKLLAHLIKEAKLFTTYTGAGISTASGIGDYASSESSSAGNKKSNTPFSPFKARPTFAHHVLAQLHKKGYLKHWIQQNHDGLPQKAGFPQASDSLNEIHGAWFDPSNPVVKMNESLRDDLFQKLLEWEKKIDFLLVLGTSLAGMNADRVVGSCCKRFKKGKGMGSVIISLQRTQYDEESSLRIFGKLDNVMLLLAKELNLTLPVTTSSELDSYVFKLGPIPPENIVSEDVYYIPYDSNGNPTKDTDRSLRRLDLREDKKVKITTGKFEGDEGIVLGKNEEGHYRIQFRHEIGKNKSFKAPMVRMFGLWFIESGVKGSLDKFPIVSI